MVIRFAGDSGDGMQLTGDRFTSVSAWLGNDLATLPEFPAEIRAPAGTLAGVSAFQVHISDHDITTPGDAPNVLIAMNPAALRNELNRVEQGGTLIINIDTFDERNLEKAGYTSNPLTDDSLRGYPGRRGADDLPHQGGDGVARREAARRRPLEELLRPRAHLLGVLPPGRPGARLDRRALRRNDLVRTANRAAFQAGWNFGETTEVFDHQYEIKRATLPAGEYTQITGNTALAWGLVAAGQQAHLPVFLGSYPITPASDILHELAKHKNFGVRTLQAEDEIAAVGTALGAAFAGHLGVTTTSGPGLALKSETISLAISLELPLLVIDIQRGGPSTGLPTKTEAADLNIGAVRPPRRGAAARRRRVPTVALLRRRHRGGPHRPQVPHAGDPAVRRLHRQRRRAVAPARRGVAARHLGAVRDRVEPRTPTTGPRSSGRTCATPRPCRGRGRFPARPDLMHRVGGHREGGRHRQHLLRARRTTSAWCTCGPPRWPASPRTSRRPWSAGRGRRVCSSSAGARPGRPSTRPSSGWPVGARRWPGSTSSTSTRCPPTSARSCGATPASWCRR